MSGRAFVSRFSPNRTDPKVLEAIFVQRHRLAEVWLERLRDSVLTGTMHHLLAVGPRGCGKSHLVSLLVSRLRKDPEITERVRIARLPEDETTPSFWKFLLRILRALNAEYGDEFPPPPRDRLEGEADDRRAAVLSSYLRERLGSRTLLVVVENLDDVMRGLKDEGQKRWRAFLQEHPVAATLATSQQLTESLSRRDRPFFNFFQVERLQPLTSDQALELLGKLADQGGEADLSAFLKTPTGRARVRAIRHVTGGSHRVFIILSEFVTRQKLDDLVSAFEELLDELTPYYQERLRWLPDQQREIVEFLCRQARTVMVKEIAGELFLKEQVAASQLKGLRDKGYVTSASVGRESRYELAEPLMRLCVEIKDPEREPIRLIVEFLRIWYDRSEVETRLHGLAADAALERRYFLAVLQPPRPDIPDPIKAALERDLEAARASGESEDLVCVLVDLAATADSEWRCLAIAHELNELGRHAEALDACGRALELDPQSVIAWNNKGTTLNVLGRHVEALDACDRALELDPRFSAAWNNKGYALNELGRHAEAFDAFELDPQSAAAWHNKGYVLNKLGRHAEALDACDRALELDPQDAATWHYKGYVLNKLGRHTEALDACGRALELDPKSAVSWRNLGHAKLVLKRLGEATEDFRRAIELNPQLASGFDSLTEAHIINGRWEEAERTLAGRFRLSPSRDNPAKAYQLTSLLATLFRVSGDRPTWAHRIGRLVEIAAEAQEEAKRVEPDGRGAASPLAMLGDALVRSLTNAAYVGADAAALDAWAGVWREVAGRHPDLTLAVRLFEVGLRYVRTKDERALFDLVSEERGILRDLFGLDEGPDEG